MTSVIQEPFKGRIHVAVPGPFLEPLSYLSKTDIQPGVRVLVPLGSRRVIGVVVEKTVDSAAVDQNKLKPIIEPLDDLPLLTEQDLNLANWMSRYYLHEFSSAYLLCLPSLLRKGESAQPQASEWITPTLAGLNLDPEQLKRSKAQQQLISLIQKNHPISLATLRESGFSRQQINAVEKKGLLNIEQVTQSQAIKPSGHLKESPLTLNSEQEVALAQLAHDRFAPFLLEGITGSGKTEIYLQAIAHCLAKGRRALILVPEIGLTPQTIKRFEQRFTDTLVALHSGLSDNQRLKAWLQAKLGQAAIIIGTRSAVLTPIPDLGLIVIDEEHDVSFKQQDTLRYNARDVALKRAQLANIPILLGSATPSLETLHNAATGRFGHMKLTARAAGFGLPNVETIDMRNQNKHNGLSERLLLRAKEHLDNGNQVLFFLQRRGYAPSWFCEDCGWIADCTYCDANLTHHRQNRLNICHHCGHTEPPVHRCPACQSAKLGAMGTGTERAEELLQSFFPSLPIIRFDRDAASTRNKFEQQLAKTEEDGPAIIVGTQMLAKGHHFNRVTLVGIWDIDVGLFSADLRARERMGQLLTQVAGRSGRGKRRGEVLVQTYYPDDPLFVPLIKHDYRSFALTLLQERKKTGLPPFGFIAIIRCDSAFADRAEGLLSEMAHFLLSQDNIRVLGPIPALLARKAGKHRYLLIVQSAKRSHLHEALTPLHRHYPREAKQVSWHIDIDPAELS